MDRRLRVERRPGRRAGRGGGRPGVAALPRRWPDGLPGRPDGGRPDPFRAPGTAHPAPSADVVTSFLLVSGASLLAVAVLMAVTAWIAHRIGKVSVVDTSWGLGFVLVALVAALLGGPVAGGDAARRWVWNGRAWGWERGCQDG